MLTYIIITTIVFLCGNFFHVEFISAYYMFASFFYLYYQIDHDHYTFKKYLTYMVPFTIIAFLLYVIAIQITHTVQFNTTISALSMQLFFMISSILLKRQFRM